MASADQKPWRCGRRRSSRRPGSQGPAGGGHREHNLSCRSSGRSGRDSHRQVTQGAGHDRLRPPGLAIRRNPRRVLLPSIRFDRSPFGVECNWTSQCARLGRRESVCPRGLCRLTVHECRLFSVHLAALSITTSGPSTAAAAREHSSSPKIESAREARANPDGGKIPAVGGENAIYPSALGHASDHTINQSEVEIFKSGT